MVIRTQQALFCAKLCSYLQDPSTCCSQIVSALSNPADFVVDKTRITLVDGVHSGEDAKVLIVEHRRTDDPGLHQVTIVFRGSGNVEKELWLLNRLAEEPEILVLDRAPGDTPLNVPVHRGLMRMYRSVEAKIREVIRQCPPRTQVVMTGWGTGGALARIGALDCAWRNQLDRYHVDVPFKIITFGTPVFSGKQMTSLLHRAGVNDDANFSGALDPVTRWNHSPRKIKWLHSSVGSTWWIYWDSERGSVVKLSDTIPANRMWGLWKIPDDPREHDIGKIISHLRSVL